MPRGWSPCSRCPNVVPPGQTTCTTCRTQADRKRRPNGNPYSSRGHHAFREAVLARNPHCVCTGDCGTHQGWCGRPATVADHHPTERVDLVDMGANPDDPAHGRGVCTPCHNRKTARTKTGGFNIRT